jgi:POT family proton-dependent oligopeptide transporter
MAVPTTPTFFIGMLLIVLGTGLLKPNISAIVGQLYGADTGARRDAGFSIFYMSINIGAFVGQLICGYLGEKVGWHYGFGAAGVFMVLGLAQYRLTGRSLGDAGKVPASTGDAARDARLRRKGWAVLLTCLALLAIFVVALLTGVLRLDPVNVARGTGVLIVAVVAAYFAYVLSSHALDAAQKRKVVVIAIFFAAAALFWSGFEQAGSSFNLFADRYTNRLVFGWEMPASWLQSVNPFFIILLAPAFAALWVRLGAANINPSTPLKFGLGLIQLGLGFLVLYFASLFVAAGEQVAPTWLALTYLFHTTGELCLSPVGLSAVTKLAPPRYVGQMMGTWFMGSALGNLVGGLVAGYFGEDSVATMPGRFLSVFATAAGGGVLLLLGARAVRKLMGGIT